MAFSLFLDQARPAAEERVSFRIDASDLKDATVSIRLVTGSTKEAVAAVRCALLPNHLKLSAYSCGTFAEEIVPAEDVAGVEMDGTSFVLDVAVLVKIGTTFPRGPVLLDYDAARRLLCASAGRARVEFPGMPTSQHTDYSGKIGFPAFACDVPVELLRMGLRYAGLFTPATLAEVGHIAAQDVSYTVRLADNSLGEVHQGIVAGGSQSTALAFESASLRGCSFGVQQRSRDFVIKALGRLDPGNTQLYHTTSFSILIDGKRMFGLERPTKGYPVEAIKKHVRTRPSDFVTASREALRAALSRVATVSDRTESVQLAISGVGAEAALTIRMSDPSGRLAEDSLGADRKQEQGLMFGRPREALLNVVTLSTLLAHFSGPQVRMSFDGPILRVFDVVGDATATSILVCEAPPPAARVPEVVGASSQT